jgi:WD40-like Beta Propeller Repeat
VVACARVSGTGLAAIRALAEMFTFMSRKVFMRMAFVLLLSVGCGNVSGSPADAHVEPSVDAQLPVADAPVPPADAPVDAPPVCDPTKPFGTPVLVRGLETTPASVPRLSLDERTLYFTNAGVAQSDLYVARQGSSGVFGPSQPLLSPPNSAASEYDPTLSPDGMTLWFSSDRVNGSSSLPQSLYIATRTGAGDFDNANPGALNSADTVGQQPYNMGQPYLPAAGTDLWFTSSRADGKGLADIWHATLNGSAIGVQHPATELNSNVEDSFPTVSADGLTIYFSSTRPTPGTTATKDSDIWTSHRAHVSDDFSAPVPVTELNTPMTEYPGWLSVDNCRLYMASDRAQGIRIYVATRQP